MDNQTFAYILLASPYFKEIERMYWGSIIEAFISCEEQWLEVSDLWPFGWGNLMSRVSLVQLTQGYDPLNDLMMIFEDKDIMPKLRQDLDRDKNNIVYFDKLPKDTFNYEDLSCQSKHSKRFLNILNATISLSSKKEAGLLFVGGWGFSYDMNLDLEDQETIRTAGIKYASRVP